jgi:phosphoenolpyruvate carboxylase
VLGIINDLSKALNENNTGQINMYLQQLGKTPFLRKQRPSPYDEAVSLIWYLENIFYAAAGRIITHMKSIFPEMMSDENPIITMGFWPGGDRDGNPNVNADITRRVGDTLRSSIIKCYYRDVRNLKRRLTFKGVDTILNELESQLYNNFFVPGSKTKLTRQYLIDSLNEVRHIIIYQHNGLFQHLVDNLISKVQVFGLHFASLDIRQDSSIHSRVLETLAEDGKVLPADYKNLSDEDKIASLLKVKEVADKSVLQDDVMKDTLESIEAIRDIQQFNGVEGCNRYIISQLQQCAERDRGVWLVPAVGLDKTGNQYRYRSPF